MGAKQRGAVIIVKDGAVALIRRTRGPETYFLFPGGMVEPGETVEQAAVREAHEELGVSVALGRLVAIVEHGTATQYHFIAEITGGEFGSGYGEELSSPPDSVYGSYTACWLPVPDLLRHDVRPRRLAELLVNDQLKALDEPITFQD